MHDNSKTLAIDFASKHLSKPGLVLDIGSWQARRHHWTMRELFDRWEYYGIDIKRGRNVDMRVAPGEQWPFADNSIDCVVSANCLEHVAHPQFIADETARVLTHGGKALIIVPAIGRPHYNPDYWRILPDGLRHLFRHMTEIDCGISKRDTYGIFSK